MIFLGLVFAVWCLCGLVFFALGILRTPKAAPFLQHLVIAVSVFYVPMVVLGRKMIQRRLYALWGGFLLTLVGLTMELANVFGLTISEGIDSLHREGDAARLVIDMLLTILTSIQLFACVTALVAYYANRTPWLVRHGWPDAFAVCGRRRQRRRVSRACRS